MVRKLLFSLSLTSISPILAACNSSAPPPVQAPAPVDNALQGFVMKPEVAALGERERRTAGDAQFRAVSEGQRISWKGSGGSFGFVEPGPERPGPSGVCRDYAHTIYLNGRPVRGAGEACRSASGVWRIVS